VVYASSTSALATGSGITYDGTTFSTTNDASISGLTVGKGAGAVSTNTAVGASALSSGSLSGAYNTGVGYQTLQANTTGSSNSAFGLQSLVANTTGYNNSAYGAISLYANTTGVNNTAIGEEALRTNTTASNNTAVGYQAGYSNTDQANNVFIGYQSGYANTAGYRQTFVGTNSGNAITTGVKNTIIGGYTGNQSGLDIRTASNYIVLSDGDGNPRGIFNNSGNFIVGNDSALSQVAKATFVNTGGNAIVALCANGNTAFTSTNTSGTANYYGAIFSNNGNTFSTCGYIAISGTTTSYVTSSDYRLKEDVQPMTGALAKVAQLKPVTYKWKVDGSDGQGFIAHELAEVCPQAVSGEKDAVKADGSIMPQGIDTSFLVATLTAAIQEQQALIDSLTTRLTALESK